MRPQPVHVKLHACSGSSISTMGNFSVPRKRLLAMYFARFAVIFSGYLINYLVWRRGALLPPGESQKRGTLACLPAGCDIVKARTKENSCDKGGILNRTRPESRSP